ncbi:molybdopterin-guanine dinucleotide biosynthesis protein MobB, partial [Adlercreutzia equolifaciens]|uniref:molybdopterin-guanine dinucleotide biosynthesis protein B n=1 Tax=Adlercreutzia equolifaciens TaxID=446660 RepID=UPI0023B0619E
HHSHRGFDIDYPGKDSYRHRAAGASETVIAAPGQVARIQTVEGEVECAELVRSMPGHDVVVVEGYRKSGLPTIEIMRSGNEADARAAAVLLEAARADVPLGTDFTQLAREHDHLDEGFAADLREKRPVGTTIALVTDIPDALEAASLYG